MYFILGFVSFFEAVICFTLMSSSVMQFKDPIKKRIVMGLIAMTFGITLLSYTLFSQGIESVDSFAILVILLIQLSWFLICSADRFFVSLFNFLTLVNIYVSTSYISNTLASDFDGNAYLVAYMMIRLAIYLIIIPLLFRFVRPRFRRLVDALDREWRASSLVPLMFLMMQIVTLYYPAPFWTWTSGSWSRVIIVTVYLLFLAVYYFLYIQANAIVEKYALEKRQLLMGQQEKLWESELIRQKATADLAFQQKHDMHHHNAVIMDMLLRGESDKIKAYITSFDTALDKYNSNSFCKNPIANSIMNLYANKAAEENIKTEFYVSVPEDTGIDNIDLTCVLGNTLENALEGCLKLHRDAEKEIIVRVKYFDRRLRVQVENTCIPNISFDREIPVSQKQGGGTGTKSILYTAERYDGTAGFSVQDGKFITHIVLNGK